MVKNGSLFQNSNQKPTLFFLGIGGVSMSSLAFTAKKMGCSVSGYDLAPSGITQALSESGIPVYHDFSPSYYENVDLVVFTGAVRESDPVRSYPKSIGIPEISRARFLGLLMKEYQNPIGIAGTHGKSTTTGMLSSIFLSSPDRDPVIMAGAALSEIGGMYRLGEGEDFVFEACEYQNSFLDFYPRLSVVLNVEHDHADFFPTLEDVIESFVKFCDLAKSGYAVLNFDQEGARKVAEKTLAPLFFFSMREKKDLWCENRKEKNGFFSFDLFTKEGPLASVTLSVPGEHNVQNALAAASAAYLSGISGEEIKKGLEAFRGVKRRFEYRGKCGEMAVFDDYAHHPDEIEATLRTAKKLGYEKVTVVFQPHTFTRTEAYWDRFLESLSLADEVIFADIYPAREDPIPGITAENLAKESKNGKYLGDFYAIAKSLRASGEKGLLIVMGAGTIVSLTDLLIEEEKI